MTYAEALKNGYKIVDITYARGYVSRKCNPNDQPVKTAGGKRKGQMYVELPNWQSTRYLFRVYLAK